MNRTPEQYAADLEARRLKVELAEKLSFDLMEKLPNSAVEYFARNGMEDLMLSSVMQFRSEVPYTQEQMEQRMKAAIQRRVDKLNDQKEKQHP